MSMRSIRPAIFFFTLLVSMMGSSACSAETETVMQTDEISNMSEDSRLFRLGFTPQAFTGVDFEDSIDTAYELIDKHGDVIALHLADGVPWNEALKGGDWKTWHPNVRRVIQRHKDNLERFPNLPVFLSLTPLDNNRTGLAGYWAKDSHLPLKKFPGKWHKKAFDDPKVVKAYVSFAMEMVQELDPDYLAYAIEVSSVGDLRATDKERFDGFGRFLKQVYTQLKDQLSIPVFLTFVLLDEKHWNENRAVHDEWIRYSDWIAVSTYPYMRAWPLNRPEVGNPATMEKNWFSKVVKAYPDKPFAVAETGFPAEDLTLFSPDISKGTIPPVRKWKSELVAKASPEHQRDYVEMLLCGAARHEARFVIWFVPVDYDRMWDIMSGHMKPDKAWFDAFKQWRDCGLWDGQGKNVKDPGKSRPAFETWKRYQLAPLHEASD